MRKALYKCIIIITQETVLLRVKSRESGKKTMFILIVFQNNNLEHALDWIFTHPDHEEESEAASDTADQELDDGAFSGANGHSDTSPFQTQERLSPMVKDGPGRKCPRHAF